MTEQDPMHDALEAVLRTFQTEPSTARAIGAGCIKPGLRGEPAGTGGCAEGELIFGEKPGSSRTADAAMAQGPSPQEDASVCGEQGSAPTKAEQLGLDEAHIKRIMQSLLSARSSTDRRIVFLRASNRLESAPGAEAVHAAVSEHRTNQIRENEKGPLLHYHQTPADNLDTILDQGGLLSTKLQRERGLPFRSTGSRPESVQFTRDSYDKNGNLVRSGLVGGNSLGVDGGIALVYGGDIMDVEGYDSVDTYPAVPSAPNERLRAVIVSDPNQVDSVKAKLAAKGVTAKVTTRDQWPAERRNSGA